MALYQVFYPSLSLQDFTHTIHQCAPTLYITLHAVSEANPNMTLKHANTVPILPFHSAQPSLIYLISKSQHALLQPKKILDIQKQGGTLLFSENSHRKLTSLINFLNQKKITYLTSPAPMVTLYQVLNHYLSARLAPRFIMHGSFMDIHGRGVLFTGKPGVGKSQTVLSLLKRGHRLIADDAPIFYQQGLQLMGTAPPELRHKLAIQSSSIIDTIDITQHFGMTAFKDSHPLDIVIELTDNSTQSPQNKTQWQTETISGLRFLKIQLAFNQNIAILVEHTIQDLSNQPTYFPQDLTCDC